ncbi:hypothetical protein chiPu_0026577 [Chiloscyllium punctatum]|uniref:Uncharacterized protein n=1 Tax=Chiloscyllium punctatum TaxID=137246 RepID=A0A401TJ61_CHIPU|nr:hypothetical protein [Chiloscyllium punctatum]
MFKKSRRNFRRRNDSEEEEREDGVAEGGGLAAEAPLTNNSHEKGAELLPLPTPPAAPQIGSSCEAGAVLPLLGNPAIGLPGPLAPVNTLPAAPAPLRAGPGLAPPKAASGLALGKAGPCIAAAKLAAKDKKRSREREAPRAALLSFQDEEEGEERPPARLQARPWHLGGEGCSGTLLIVTEIVNYCIQLHHLMTNPKQQHRR